MTRSAARRSHRALSSDDVLSTVLSFIDPLAGFGAATTSKTLRDAWRRRCRGMLLLRKFSLAGKGWNDDPTNGTMAVQGDMLYVTCKRNCSVDEYRWRDGTLMRRFGGRNQPLSFCSPFGVAIRGKTMYVSEILGSQIQVLRLPDDDSSEPTVLQVIPSPDGEELGGLCVNGDRLWCMGPKQPRATRDTYVHLFGPCYE